MAQKLSIRERISNFATRARVFFGKAIGESYASIYLSDGAVGYVNTSDPRVALSFTAVYACVNVISGTIATLPCGVYKRAGGEKQKDYKHHLHKLLYKSPNEITTAVTFWETTLMHLLLQGNSYSEIVRDHLGNVRALHILNPLKMSVYLDTDGTLFYVYRSNGKETYLSRKDVLHIAGKSLDGIVGLSPISLFARIISTGIEQEKLTHKFFATGAKKLPIFSHPGTIAKEGKEELKRNITEAWDKARPIMLEGGVTTETVTMNMTDAQLVESKIFSVSEIARIFRVPLHKINELSHATFSNIEHQSMEFVSDTILPWCVRIEQALNLQLFDEEERDGYFIKFNLDGLLRGDTASRNTSLEIQLRNGIINRRDWAKIEDLPLPKDERAEDYFLTQQLRPMDEAYTSEETSQPNENKNEDDGENIKNTKEDEKNA